VQKVVIKENILWGSGGLIKSGAKSGHKGKYIMGVWGVLGL
jgi:hypothetical protein